MSIGAQNVIPAIERLVGDTIERLHTDAGYRGHNAPIDYRFKIFTPRQKRRVTPKIKREMRRRFAIEPVIGHLRRDSIPREPVPELKSLEPRGPSHSA